ncbi:hypothetical protein BpHYR1_045367 [Brachionus plicatilis]|uniref:Uncharacterized protein n=1 Tax=Brachionus plicatilis TaxID=10195 RepID=A0A3M7RK69_BRAPC|nr:hypothetical protein BpHYR1_045367 [Brachionus plicatilis]
MSEETSSSTSQPIDDQPIVEQQDTILGEIDSLNVLQANVANQPVKRKRGRPPKASQKEVNNGVSKRNKLSND